MNDPTILRFLQRAAITAVASVLCVGIAAEAAELKVLSSLGMQSVFAELGPQFERASGHKLTIPFDSAGGVVKRVEGGEVPDVVVTVQAGIDKFVKDGRTASASITAVAQSGIALAVRKGAPKPDISSHESLKRTLLAAKSIAYANPALGGASGIHFAKVLDRLGIAEEAKAKTIFLSQPGPVGALVANGQAEIAVQQYPELLQVAGLEIVGPLPGDLQETLVFSAAIMANARDTGASRMFISFMRTPEASAVIRAKGMQPAAPS